MIVAPPSVADVAAALARAGHDPVVSAEPSAAAVAAVLREDGSGTEILLIHRAEHPGDPWSGQMGLPGGRVDPVDATAYATAVRETREELTLDLEGCARTLGRLPTMRTHLRSGPGPLTVTPFVFALADEPELCPNYEVQEALWVPLAFFLDRANRSILTWTRARVPLPFPCYRYHGRVVWGLTLRILETLLELPREA